MLLSSCMSFAFLDIALHCTSCCNPRQADLAQPVVRNMLCQARNNCTRLTCRHQLRAPAHEIVDRGGRCCIAGQLCICNAAFFGLSPCCSACKPMFRACGACGACGDSPMAESALAKATAAARCQAPWWPAHGHPRHSTSLSPLRHRR